MGYYNWSEILPKKSDTELRAIIRNRMLGEEAIQLAKNELAKRNDPVFQRNYQGLKKRYSKKWVVNTMPAFDSACPKCYKEIGFVQILEKNTSVFMSFNYINLFGLHFTFSNNEFLKFLGLEDKRVGVLGACLSCHEIMIKCGKCECVQEFIGDRQACVSCRSIIKKPDKV